MGVTAIDSTASTNLTNTNKSNISSESFLFLFVEQLKNQDPLQPMDNTEYITQLAQISLLEQATKLGENMDKLVNLNFDSNEKINSFVNQFNLNLLGTYSNLIGKTGYWYNSDGSEISGKIDGIIQKDQQFYALANNNQILVSDFYKVDLGDLDE